MNSNQAKQTWNFYLVPMKVASIIATNERDTNTTVMENALAISLKIYCIYIKAYDDISYLQFYMP